MTRGYTSSVFYRAPFLDLYITTQLLYFETVPKLLFKTNMVARVYYFNPGAFVAVQVGPTGLNRHLC